MIIDPYRWYAVRVTHVLHDSLDAVTVQTERPADYAFEPGQHAIIRVTLRDGSQRLRQYSYAGSPSSNHLVFAITRSPDGEVSSWFIDSATTASVIEISQPFTGPLQLDIGSYNHIGMVAGGSGIAPILSYVKKLREASDAPFRTILYSTRASSQINVDSLDATPQEAIIITISDIDGRMTNDKIVNSLTGCDLILLCGSRQFVSQLHSLCTDRLPTAEIRAEAFSLI